MALSKPTPKATIATGIDADGLAVAVDVNEDGAASVVPVVTVASLTVEELLTRLLTEQIKTNGYLSEMSDAHITDQDTEQT